MFLKFFKIYSLNLLLLSSLVMVTGCNVTTTLNASVIPPVSVLSSIDTLPLTQQPTPTPTLSIAATPSPTPTSLVHLPAPQSSPTPTPTPSTTGGFVYSPYWQPIDSGANIDKWPSGLSVMTWAFAVNECGNESWEAGYSPVGFIPSLVNAGKKYIISTGGWGSIFTCGSDSGFSTFIDRYYSSSLIGIDFDIEYGQTSTMVNNLVQRVKVAQANPKYANLRFSFTVGAVTSTGIDAGGYGGMVMNAIRQFGLNNYYINLMTMDMTLDQNTNLGQWTIQSAQALHNKYGVPYSQIEVTPMAGPDDNHVPFTLANASAVSKFASQNGLGGIHLWEFGIDLNQYGLSYTNAFLRGL